MQTSSKKKKRTIIPVLEHNPNATGLACQDVSDARVQERQAALPVRFAPVDYDDWRARTRPVVTRVDPKALRERRFGGVVKVVERLRERLRAELRCGGASSSERKLGHSSPPLCRMLLLRAGRAGDTVQLPEVDPLSVMVVKR